MLLNDLYTIHSLTEVENKIDAIIELRTNHAIFKGHFPGQPVLPGVCMMQIINEIAGKYLNQKFSISGARMIKFLRMIDPNKTPLIRVEIQYKLLTPMTTTSGKIYLGSEIFMKFQIDFISITG